MLQSSYTPLSSFCCLYPILLYYICHKYETSIGFYYYANQTLDFIWIFQVFTLISSSCSRRPSKVTKYIDLLCLFKYIRSHKTFVLACFL